MILLLLISVASACGGGTGDSADAAGDSGAATDASSDAARDSGSDGPVDAGMDGSTYTKPDSSAALFVPDPDRIYNDISVLASAAYQGRFTGTTGGNMAIEFVRKRFESLGLEAPQKLSSHLQPFPWKQWYMTGPSKFELDGRALVEGADYVVLRNSAGASFSSGVVFAGYGMTVPAYHRYEHPECPLNSAGYDDYEGIDAAGKIVVVLRGTPNDNDAINDGCPANITGSGGATGMLGWLDYKGMNAKLHGAIGMILVQNLKNPPGFAEKIGFSEPGEDRPAAFFANRDSLAVQIPDLAGWAGKIDSELKPGAHETPLQATAEIKPTISLADTDNVIGVIPGTDPVLGGETVLIGAHFDHIGTNTSGEIFFGADDNASGTSVMLELARAAVESGLKPARTIIFAGWNGEEEGLKGSCFYVNNNPLYPLESMKAAFSVDMVGAGNGTGLYLYGSKDWINAWIADLMAGAAHSKGLKHTVQVAAALNASDHACFARDYIPAVLALSLRYPEDHLYYHTSRDTPDTINQDDLKSSVELMWAALVPLAEGNEGYFISLGKNKALKTGAETPKALERRLSSGR
jgi:hypothetical protein